MKYADKLRADKLQFQSLSLPRTLYINAKFIFHEEHGESLDQLQSVASQRPSG